MNTHSALSLFTSCAPLHLFLIPPFQLSISVFTIWVRSSLPEVPKGWQRGSYPTQKVVRQSVYPWLPPWVSTRHFSLTLFMGHSSWPAWPYFRLVLICKKKKIHLAAKWWKTALPLALHAAPSSVLMAHSCVYLPLNLRLQHKTGQCFHWCLETWIKIQ